MTTQTIAQMTGAVGLPSSGAGYRRIRATSVLGASSQHVQRMQDADLNKALARLRKVNFDMDRLSNRNVELLYAHFDKKMSKKITDEFQFHASLCNIQDHGTCSAFCDLCGKGDSLDGGENQDKLRYTFKLSNHAGGEDVWVGSSCILQHGLHVDGAATAEEAKEILRKSLQAHLTQWRIEAWQAEHPDHTDIPAQWEAFRYWRPRTYQEAYWTALGFDVFQIDRERHAAWKRFRTASKFYARKAHLSINTNTKSETSKTQDWLEAKRLLKIADLVNPMIREAMDIRYRDSEPAAIVFLEGKRKERDEKIARLKAQRKAKRKPARARRTRKPSRAKKGGR